MSIADEVRAGLIEAGEATGGQLTCTIRRLASDTGNAYTAGTRTFAEYASVMIWSDWTALERAGTLIEARDRRALVAVFDVAPDVSDSLRVGSDTFQIVEVRAVAPAGVPIMWDLRMRK